MDLQAAYMTTGVQNIFKRRGLERFLLTGKVKEGVYKAVHQAHRPLPATTRSAAPLPWEGVLE